MQQTTQQQTQQSIKDLYSTIECWYWMIIWWWWYAATSARFKKWLIWGKVGIKAIYSTCNNQHQQAEHTRSQIQQLDVVIKINMLGEWRARNFAPYSLSKWLDVNASNKSLIIALDFSSQPLLKIIHWIKAKNCYKSY